MSWVKDKNTPNKHFSMLVLWCGGRVFLKIYPGYISFNSHQKCGINFLFNFLIFIFIIASQRKFHELLSFMMIKLQSIDTIWIIWVYIDADVRKSLWNLYHMKWKMYIYKIWERNRVEKIRLNDIGGLHWNLWYVLRMYR